MSRVFSLLVIFICTWTINANVIQTRQEDVCKDNGGYINTGICCSNCPAGTFVKQPCNSASNTSKCEPCELGSHTEHSNGLRRCLPCDRCRLDQEQVTTCTTTRNTQCQCKAGLFCLPNQACEICKTCTKCKEDEEMVKSCTAQSNTVCQKKEPDTSKATIISVCVVIVLLLLIGVFFLFWWTSPDCCSTVTTIWQRQVKKTCSRSNMDEERQNELNRELESQNRPVPLICLSQPQGEGPAKYEEEEEDRGLGQSLPNTTTSSRESLPLLQQPTAPELERLPKLVPLNGEDSLRKSFDLFSEIDVNFQNRFFRRIGLKDNDIRSAVDFRPEDRVYELLRVWIEKEGMAADFNDLLSVLLDLNQRLTAENIHSRVRADGLFELENMK